MFKTYDKRVLGISGFLNVEFIAAAAIITLLIIFIASLCRAEERYVVGKGGIYSPSGGLADYDFEEGSAGEVAVGQEITSTLAIEGGLGYIQTRAKYEAEDFMEEDRITIIPVTLILKFFVPVSNKFKAYTGGGVGLYHAELESDFVVLGEKDTVNASDDVLGVHAVMGVNYIINKRIWTGVEAKHIWTEDAEAVLTPFGEPIDVNSDLNGWTMSAVFGVMF